MVPPGNLSSESVKIFFSFLSIAICFSFLYIAVLTVCLWCVRCSARLGVVIQLDMICKEIKYLSIY